MKTYASSIAARWALLPLVFGALSACTGSESDEQIPAQELAMAPPAESAPDPVVQGLGGDAREPAIGDTIDLRKIGYTRGAADAPVTVYEFSDFGCPFCSTFARGTYPQMHEEFVATGRVRWTYVPFVMGMFPNGAESASAAECAAVQEKFWEMHDLLYEKQNEWDDLSAFADGCFDLVVALGVYHSAESIEEWERAVAESARVLKPRGRLLVNHFTPEVDLTGEAVRAVAGEPGVYEGLADGRGVLLERDSLDAAMGRHGLLPAVRSETARVETERGRRVSVNALYVPG